METTNLKITEFVTNGRNERRKRRLERARAERESLATGVGAGRVGGAKQFRYVLFQRSAAGFTAATRAGRGRVVAG